MKQSQVYRVDIAKIDGEGEFPCPSCGSVISPDDETEDVYVILNTKLKGDTLQELLIQCNRCKSKIQLTGFLPTPASNENIVENDIE
jgi:DNA-directed RNA polymerase subunit RPC12/RpoP